MYEPDPLGEREAVLPKFSWQLHQRREYIWRDHLRFLSWPEDLDQWKVAWRPGFHTFLEQTSISPHRPSTGSPRRSRRREDDLMRDAIFATDRGLASGVLQEDPDMWELAQSLILANASLSESDDPADWVGRATERQVVREILRGRFRAPSGSALERAQALTERRDAAKRLLRCHVNEERMQRDLAIVFGETNWNETDYVSFPTAVRESTGEDSWRCWELTDVAIEDLVRLFPDLAGSAANWWAQSSDAEAPQ